ncbi:hypothetical protein HYX17_00520 [Candidatus Woesearchaeota archaeon]|nr:hypothetical protein [Candidatus Woesearchaeota archaeon]
MKSRIKRGLATLVLGASLALTPNSYGFFHGNHVILEHKRLEDSYLTKCRGDFKVFEEFETEVTQPYVAILNIGNLKVGSADNLKVRLQRTEFLGDYLRSEVIMRHNYNYVEEKKDGIYVCGIVHNKASVQIDKDNKTISISGGTKDSGGAGGGSGGGSGGGGGGGA